MNVLIATADFQGLIYPNNLQLLQRDFPKLNPSPLPTMAQDIGLSNNFESQPILSSLNLAKSTSKSISSINATSPKPDSCPIEDCQSVINVHDALKFYQRLSRGEKIMDDDEILTYFNKNNTIINDYHHIILQHLSTGDKHVDNKTFNTIDKMFRKSIKCDINKCMNYKRNHRHRNTESSSQSDPKSEGLDKNKENEVNGVDEYAQEKLMNSTFKLEHTGDPMAIFYKQFLDSVHCYFIHAIDVGFRVKIDDNDNENEEENKMNYNANNNIIGDDGNFNHQLMSQFDDEGKIDLDSSEMYQDKQIEKIKAKIHSQRKSLQSLGRVQFNKFNTEIS